MYPRLKKEYGNRNTHLELSEKADEAYHFTWPIDIFEHEEMWYRVNKDYWEKIGPDYNGELLTAFEAEMISDRWEECLENLVDDHVFEEEPSYTYSIRGAYIADNLTAEEVNEYMEDVYEDNQDIEEEWEVD